MNEYPNSIRNNMVNTDHYRNANQKYENEYNLRIYDTAVVQKKHDIKKEKSAKICKIVAAALIATALTGGTVALNAWQSANLERAQEVIYQDSNLQIDSLRDYTLKICANGTGYFEDQNGNTYGNVNGFDAQDLANTYVDSGIVELKAPYHSQTEGYNEHENSIKGLN